MHFLWLTLFSLPASHAHCGYILYRPSDAIESRESTEPRSSEIIAFIIAGILAVGLLANLVYALLNPEKLQ